MFPAAFFVSFRGGLLLFKGTKTPPHRFDLITTPRFFLFLKKKTRGHVFDLNGFSVCFLLGKLGRHETPGFYGLGFWGATWKYRGGGLFGGLLNCGDWGCGFVARGEGGAGGGSGGLSTVLGGPHAPFGHGELGGCLEFFWGVGTLWCETTCLLMGGWGGGGLWDPEGGASASSEFQGPFFFSRLFVFLGRKKTCSGARGGPAGTFLGFRGGWGAGVCGRDRTLPTPLIVSPFFFRPNPTGRARRISVFVLRGPLGEVKNGVGPPPPGNPPPAGNPTRGGRDIVLEPPLADGGFRLWDPLRGTGGHGGGARR